MCDTRTLELNNSTWGEQATDKETVKATRELEHMEEEPLAISPSMFEGWTSARSTKTAKVTSNVGENSAQMYHVENHVAKAGVIDDSYWRTLHINSEGNNLCSYRLLN